MRGQWQAGGVDSRRDESRTFIRGDGAQRFPFPDACNRMIIAWSMFMVMMMWVTTLIQLILALDIVYLRPREIPVAQVGAGWCGDDPNQV